MAGRKKVTIVGGGQTGGIMAYHLAQKNICDIVIKDVAEFAQHHGKSLDIMQGGPFGGFETKITPTDDWDATKDSDVIVITSGAPRKPGMTREDLLKTNADVVGDYAAKNAAQLSPNAIMIIFANPMDVMCHAAARATGLPRNQIIGQGGMLDSSRFRTFIAEELKVSVENVTAFVLGGHGDTMVPLPRYSTVAGIPITELMDQATLERLVKRTRDGGIEIVNYLKTGSAYYAPSAAAVEMVEAILKDKKKIMPCAAYLEGEYGINGLYVGVPVKLGERGIEQIVQIKLTAEEQAALNKSAESVKELVGVIGI